MTFTAYDRLKLIYETTEKLRLERLKNKNSTENIRNKAKQRQYYINNKDKINFKQNKASRDKKYYSSIKDNEDFKQNKANRQQKYYINIKDNKRYKQQKATHHKLYYQKHKIHIRKAQKNKKYIFGFLIDVF